MDVATLNARELTNQFGALVSDLYGTDSARAARARIIFVGVLGRNLSSGETPRLQLSLILVGGPAATLDVDTYVFSRVNNSAVTALFSNDQAAFNGHHLNGSSVQPLTDAVTGKRVEAAALADEKGMPSAEVLKACATPGYGVAKPGFRELL